MILYLYINSKDLILPIKTWNLNTQTWAISFEFYTKINFLAYLQEMSTLFGEMSAYQVLTVYGFSHVWYKESAHNFFRFLMCRDVNMASLEGVIFDHACGLDQYLLNREPREFQFLRCLVDGSHWQGQKKLKKPNRSGKGGHLGCSESFNFNLYKVCKTLFSFLVTVSLPSIISAILAWSIQ